MKACWIHFRLYDREKLLSWIRLSCIVYERRKSLMDDNFLGFLANPLPPIWSRKPLTTEEKINENIKKLRNVPWFQSLFASYVDIFTTNRYVRFSISLQNVENLLKSERKQKMFKEDLVHTLQKIRMSQQRKRKL